MSQDTRFVCASRFFGLKIKSSWTAFIVLAWFGMPLGLVPELERALLLLVWLAGSSGSLVTKISESPLRSFLDSVPALERATFSVLIWLRGSSSSSWSLRRFLDFDLKLKLPSTLHSLRHILDYHLELEPELASGSLVPLK